jgi:hypothetical protein
MRLDLLSSLFPSSTSCISHSCYTPCPSNFPWFDHPNNIRWRAPIMKLLIVQFSPACHFLSLPVTSCLQVPAAYWTTPETVPKHRLRFAWSYGSKWMNERTETRRQNSDAGPGETSWVTTVLTNFTMTDRVSNLDPFGESQHKLFAPNGS